MSIRETELVAPVDMRPAADSFLQAALGGQVAVGQSQYYLELDTRIAADQEVAPVVCADDKVTGSGGSIDEVVRAELQRKEALQAKLAERLGGISLNTPGYEARASLIREHLEAEAAREVAAEAPEKVKRQPAHTFYVEPDELEQGTVRAPSVTDYYRGVATLMTHAAYLQERQVRAKQWPWMYGGLVKRH